MTRPNNPLSSTKRSPSPPLSREHEEPSVEATVESLSQEILIQKRELEALKRRIDAVKRRQEAERLQQKRRLEPLPFIDFLQYMDEKVFATFWLNMDGKPPKDQTDVVGKMYPRFLYPWYDFEAEHRAAFNTLRSNIGSEPLFMSLDAIEETGAYLQESEAITHKADVLRFINFAIERPAAAITTAYLHATRKTRKVMFSYNAFSRPPRSKWPLKRLSQSTPDRWAVELNSCDPKTDFVIPPKNIIVGQYKPPYVLKAAMLERATELMDTRRGDTFFREAILETWRQARSATAPGNGGNGDGGGDKAGVSGHVLVAKALCQAYHHMIGSGCKYGYISSGDSLILLRVNKEAPERLYYHSVRFTIPPYADLFSREFYTKGLRQPHKTAAAYMASLCLWATRDSNSPQTLGWIEAATREALRWPSQKKIEESPQLQYALCGYDDDTLEAELVPETNKSPLGSMGFWLCSSMPFCNPRCTQACLLGLVRGLPLDNNCPNVAQHREYRNVNNKKKRTNVHPLTAAALRERVVAQIAADVDNNCKSFEWVGRYSSMFKISEKVYGYTIVGKSVQAEDLKELEKEELVYNAVPQLQGRLIPVFLGIVELARPIQLHSCIQVSHMSLMSLAGPPVLGLKTSWLESYYGEDQTAERRRTDRELRQAGVVHMEVRPSDWVWNYEAQRVMYYDFEEVCLDSLPTAAQGEEDVTKTDDVDSHGRAAKRTRTVR